MGHAIGYDKLAELYLAIAQLLNVEACSWEVVVGRPDAVEAVQLSSTAEDRMRFIVDSARLDPHRQA
jgi:hypothetical protein